jgi:hypothetical protein
MDALIMLHCLWRLPHVASEVQIDEVVADTSISLNILSSVLPVPEVDWFLLLVELEGASKFRIRISL